MLISVLSFFFIIDSNVGVDVVNVGTDADVGVDVVNVGTDAGVDIDTGIEVVGNDDMSFED